MGEFTIDAIEAAYRQRYGRFCRVATAMLGEERAHDAVQEAFARAIRGRFSFRGEATLDTWLWRTLVNVCTDEQRRRVPALGGEPSANGHVDEWPELRAAIAVLPDRQRQVLFLRHYADLDYAAIAAALQIERGTVAATLHAAHAALRTTITEAVG